MLDKKKLITLYREGITKPSELAEKLNADKDIIFKMVKLISLHDKGITSRKELCEVLSQSEKTKMSEKYIINLCKSFGLSKNGSKLEEFHRLVGEGILSRKELSEKLDINKCTIALWCKKFNVPKQTRIDLKKLKKLYHDKGVKTKRELAKRFKCGDSLIAYWCKKLDLAAG